jgi:hypothetical protein
MTNRPPMKPAEKNHGTSRAGHTLRAFVASWFILAPVLSGCASHGAVGAGTNTALDSVDLVAMTDDMAMKIVADPEVRRAIAEEGKLRVVVQPVENHMVGEILPRGPAEMFTARVRTLLAKAAPGDFTWVMNRDAFYRLRSQELDGVDLGPSPDAIDPRYALQARFSSLTDESSKRRTSYYLCVYELLDLETRNVLWAGTYEVKKTAVKGFLD